MTIAQIAKIVHTAVQLMLADPNPPAETKTETMIVDLCEADETLVVCAGFECDTDQDCYDKCRADMEALSEYGFSPDDCEMY